MMPQLTRHAEIRWKERFPKLKVENEWRDAFPCTKNVLKLIRSQCGKTTRQKIRRNSIFYKYLLSFNFVIFVYDTTGTVVTVFPLTVKSCLENMEWKVIREKNRHNICLRKKRKISE